MNYDCYNLTNVPIINKIKMLNEEFNLFEEFKKRVERLQNGNFLRIKQLSNFVKF